MSTSKQTDHENMVHTFNSVLISHKKKPGIVEFVDTRVGRVPTRRGQEDTEEQGEKAKKSLFQNVLIKK